MTASTESPREGGLAHWIVVFVVFGITGGLSVRLSGLLLRDVLGLEGGFWAGPWSYRLTYLLLIPPCYSALLATIGTLLGKGPYFRSRVVKMWRRLLPRPVADRLFGAIP
ncbi:MAG: hypothetical protein RIT45_2131 [Pseudomonadota bacterium]